MKRILPLSLLLIIVLFCFSASSSFAQLKSPSGSMRTTVEAAVGEFYLNLAGYIAPNASIVLTIDGVFARATTADGSGDFYISDVLIKKGFSHFCLDAIDFRRIGESYTCFNIPPAQASVTMKDVFLPPTLGISRTEIAEGSSATVFGYSMPGALVTLFLSNGQTATTGFNFNLIQPAFALSSAQMPATEPAATSIDPYNAQVATNNAFVGGKTITADADQTGYYEITLKNVKAGIYSMYAKAELNHKHSLEPENKVKLKSLNWWEQLLAFLKDLWNKLLKFLIDLALGPLWLLIPIIILIIILLVKLWPGGFPSPFRKKHALHHKWWMGY